MKTIEEELKREHENKLEERLAAAGIQPKPATASNMASTDNAEDDVAKLAKIAAAERERQLATEAETLPGDVSDMFSAASAHPFGM